MKLHLHRSKSGVVTRVATRRNLRLHGPSTVFSSIRVVGIFLCRICLFRRLFLHLLSDIVMRLRLLKRGLFRPHILFSVIIGRACHLFPLSFCQNFPFLPIIRPYLHPPTSSNAIKVSKSSSQCIRTLSISIRFHRRVGRSTTHCNFIVGFFFASPPITRECASYHETE